MNERLVRAISRIGGQVLPQIVQLKEKGIVEASVGDYWRYELRILAPQRDP